jgi:hypothetical protein
MKLAKLALAGLILLAASFASAQTLIERLYVMRVDKTVFDQISGMNHTCVLVYPDGRLRIEKTYQHNDGGDPDTKVYLDKLADADLKALEAVLDDQPFQDIKTDPPHGGIVKDMDTLNISVPREHLMQNIAFVNAAERKPFEKALKPFQNSLKNLEKRKIPVAKTEKSDNCEAPRVVYRTKITAGPSDDKPQP